MIKFINKIINLSFNNITNRLSVSNVFRPALVFRNQLKMAGVSSKMKSGMDVEENPTKKIKLTLEKVATRTVATMCGAWRPEEEDGGMVLVFQTRKPCLSPDPEKESDFPENIEDFWDAALQSSGDDQNMSSSQPNYSGKQAGDLSPPVFYSQSIPINELYTQDMDAYLKYQNTYFNPPQSEPADTQQNGLKITSKKISKKTAKRKTNTGCGLSSQFTKKGRTGKRLIKISISNLESSNGTEEVAAQYVVEDLRDELLDATQGLIEKIITRLSEEVTI